METESAESADGSDTEHGLVQGGGRAGVKWAGLVKDTRQGKISICSRWRLTWRPVAHTSRSRQRRSESRIGPQNCVRSAEWSSSWCAFKGNSTRRQTGGGSRRNTPSWKTKNAKPASQTLSRTGPKLRSSSSTSGSSTKALALAKSRQAKSSSSTPALSEVPKS